MDLTTTKIVDYLLGNSSELVSTKATKRLVVDKTPVQSNPFGYYLGQVNRFLFSGGLNISAENRNQSDFLQDFWKQNQMSALLENFLERTAVTGELVIVPRYINGKYNLNFYECLEYDVKDGRLVILTTKNQDGKRYYYRFDIDNENYYHYKLWNVESTSKPDWVVEKTEPHGYGQDPWVIVKNKVALKSRRGIPDFDTTAIQMCAQLLLQYSAASENFYFFGQPIFVSPDPKDTLKRLRQRVGVLQKLGPEDGGSVDILKRSGMPKEQGTHIKQLADNLYKHLGISVQSDINGKTDLSYVALKMLNEDTISTAESKWITLVDNGLMRLLELVSRLGQIDGVWRGELTEISISRNKPYFSLSPKEQIDQVTLSERLIDAGIDPVFALHFGILKNLDKTKIEELINMSTFG